MRKLLIFAFSLIFFSSCTSTIDTVSNCCKILDSTYCSTDPDTSLVLQNVQIDRIPDCIGKLTNLRLIILENIGISTLQESIVNLSNNLKYLVLIQNNFEFLLEYITNLKKLECLWVIENPLVYLPDSIGKLSNLWSISIEETKLKSLPSTMSHLQKLIMLRVRKSKITMVPEWIGELRSLELLDVSENEITTLPASIKKLKYNLEQLWIVDTKIPEDFIDTLKAWLPHTSILH